MVVVQCEIFDFCTFIISHYAIETLVNSGMDHSDTPIVEARLIDLIDNVAVMGNGVKESPADGKLCFVCSNEWNFNWNK